MQVSQVDNSFLLAQQNTQAQLDDLTKAVGRGQPTLRDPTGATILTMLPASTPMLNAQGHNVALVMNNGTASITDSTGTVNQPLTTGDSTVTGQTTVTGDVHSQIENNSGGMSLTTTSGLPAVTSQVQDTSMVSFGGSTNFVNAANTQWSAVNSGSTVVNGDLVVHGNITTDTLNSNNGAGINGDVWVSNGAFHGIIFPQVQGPVGPQGPPGPPGPPGPVSERALKHVLGPLDHSLAVIKAVKTGRFRWRDPSASWADEREHDGLFVDELADAAPGSVVTRPDGWRAPDVLALVSHLVSAVQQLSARVEELEGPR